jgi:hypothetical protein
MSAVAFNVPVNLAFDSYSQLIGAISDWLDRNDLAGSAPAMIALCESRMRRELAALTFERSAPVEIVAGVGTLPVDCDALRAVFFNDTRLDECAPNIARQYAPGDNPSGYSLEAGKIRVWPVWTGTITVLYYGKLLQLSEGTPTNDILSEHPDIYFYGAMMFAEGYLANDSRAAMFKALWDEALESLKQFYSRQRRARIRLRNPAIVM